MADATYERRPALVIKTIEGRRPPEQPPMDHQTFLELRDKLAAKGVHPPYPVRPTR